ncbi:MAG TPA: hypothetical protein VF622_11175 [Segetibacter sp.]
MAFKILLVILALPLFSMGKSTDTTRLDSLSYKALTTKIDSVGKKILIAVDSLNKAKLSTTLCIPCGDEKPSGWGIVLTFLPAILFLIILTILLFRGLSGFDLKGAMSESDYPTVIVQNDQYNPENLKALASRENLEEILPPTIKKSNIPGNNNTQGPAPHASISRYIAFLTTILTLVVALCISCFYIYHYLRTGCPPDISGITTILLALGIGVVPYAFNKVSSAIGKSKTE